MRKQVNGRNVSSYEDTHFQEQKKKKKRYFRKTTLKNSNPDLKQIENHL